MQGKSLPLTLMALAAIGTTPAHADTAADLQSLKDELRQLRQSYESRIQQLEARIAASEQGSGAPSPAPTAQAGSFNPETSLILQGGYTATGLDPTNWKLRGFLPPADTGDMGPVKRRGFSLAESELVLSANIDPQFRGQLNLSLSADNTATVEEAWMQTLGLGQGLRIKAGRFMSGVGALNEQHPHTWDFADAPLAYQAFFAGRLRSEGLQVKWLAPTERYLEFGAEASRDDAFPGSGRNKGGIGLGSLFVHVGDDVGVSHSWRAGLSVIGTRPDGRVSIFTDAAGNDNTWRFTGSSSTLVADLIWKWAPQGNPGERNFKFQAEAFRRREAGRLTDFASSSSDYAANQSGYYLQGVYQFVPHWRLGLRYDRLDAGTPVLTVTAPPALQAWKPSRTTLMTDWSPSEFSRIRLQYARDLSRGPGLEDNQWTLQYIMSLGSHGAHRF